MKLTIVGCHSASPRYDANPTAQILEVKGHLFLIDCGEGTQVQLRKFKIKFARIKHIFISHLHGDHFFGLVGLISTFKLLGRDASLHIYGPKGIKQAILLQLKLGKTYTNFELFFHELESNQPELLFEDAVLSITTIPLKHRVYTNGFLFQQKPGERILNIEKAKKQPDKVRQALDKIKTDGIQPTIETILNKMDQPLPLGYCNVGLVSQINKDSITSSIQGLQDFGVSRRSRATQAPTLRTNRSSHLEYRYSLQGE